MLMTWGEFTPQPLVGGQTHGHELELVAIPVTDTDRAKAFYEARSGSTPTTTIASTTPFGSSSSRRPDPPARSASATASPMPTPGSVRGMQMVVDDADKALAQLSEAGRGRPGVDEQAWGRFVYFADPDGNPVGPAADRDPRPVQLRGATRCCPPSSSVRWAVSGCDDVVCAITEPLSSRRGLRARRPPLLAVRRLRRVPPRGAWSSWPTGAQLGQRLLYSADRPLDDLQRDVLDGLPGADRLLAFGRSGGRVAVRHL